MKKDLDELLKQALTPTEEPDFWLNQRILNQVKEEKRMNIRKAGKVQAAMLAAAFVIGAGSITAYATWKYLTPEKITESLHESRLTKAFQSKDAIVVNESQIYGGYRVTFLGMISGKDISGHDIRIDGEPHNDRSYIAVAIENADGTPMPERADQLPDDTSFLVSPFIRGYDPAKYNGITMAGGGGHSDFTEDGILYVLADCDNIEIFADRGLYLGVCDSVFYNSEAYNYDKDSGEITRNEDYKGLNALFDLPVDVSKADPEAAAKYKTSLDRAEENKGKENENSMRDKKDIAIDEWFKQITPENIEQYAKLIKDSVQVMTPDKDNFVSYNYKNDKGGSTGEDFLVTEAREHFGGKKKIISGYGICGDGLKDLTIRVFTFNDDGTVTGCLYAPKKSEIKKNGL